MLVWLVIFGALAGQVGLLWVRQTPGRPLALMSDNQTLVGLFALLPQIARAGEGMGHPWGSLCSPKVISHWVYTNWTENWCTRPPAMLIA